MTQTRVIAALIMAPAAICAILFLRTDWLAAAAAVVFLTGLWEWLKLSGVDDTLPRTVLLVLNLLLMVLLVWASAGSMVLFQIAALVGVGWWLLALLWLRFFDFGARPDSRGAGVLKLAAGTLAVIPAWSALLLLHLGTRETFDGTASLQDHLWLLTALAMVWAADSGAYFAGRHFGRHKLAPRISPNKTVEGLVGGLVAGLLVAAAFGLLAGLPVAGLPKLLLVAGVAVLASVLGDLFESLLKRHAGAKDSGNVIPGHGGVLDRIDGVLAALPVFALGKDILGF
ncbi:phosphatidate cytidylyltransferase [[Pseudomonas] boreopolis]|uniref:Phosphatidate cytidylyltransferase n=1 Tax=Xanthomonas boreopolis TaxID=86183 RepID=A0A919F705_9XANT|nr:phosphatidate cytidylyltransferase [[Pseudomonas] boreopolis]